MVSEVRSGGAVNRRHYGGTAPERSAPANPDQTAAWGAAGSDLHSQARLLGLQIGDAGNPAKPLPARADGMLPPPRLE